MSLVYINCYLHHWLCVLNFSLGCSWNFWAHTYIVICLKIFMIKLYCVVLLFVLSCQVVLCFVVFATMSLQMNPKKKTTTQKANKRQKMDNTRFRSTKHFERYNQFYQKALIIQERFVDLVNLKDYFIPNFFQNRG